MREARARAVQMIEMLTALPKGCQRNLRLRTGFKTSNGMCVVPPAIEFESLYLPTSDADQRV